jgi:dihydrofolate reductase
VSSVVEEWARSRVAGGELAEEIARLERASGKEVLAHGGASFVQSLAQSGLVDEYRLCLVAVATPTTGPRPHLPLPPASQQTMKITIYGWSTRWPVSCV